MKLRTSGAMRPTNTAFAPVLGEPALRAVQVVGLDQRHTHQPRPHAVAAEQHPQVVDDHRTDHRAERGPYQGLHERECALSGGETRPVAATSSLGTGGNTLSRPTATAAPGPASESIRLTAHPAMPSSDSAVEAWRNSMLSTLRTPARARPPSPTAAPGGGVSSPAGHWRDGSRSGPDRPSRARARA